VAEVVDARRGGDVLRVHGHSSVRAVELADGRRIEADLLVTATGWTAPTALLNMAGDRPVYSPRAARFLPGGGYGEDVLVAGGLAGDGGRDELVGRPARSAPRRPAARCAAAPPGWPSCPPGPSRRPRRARRPRGRAR